MAMDGDREAIRELILLSPSWLPTCRVLELRVDKRRKSCFRRKGD